MSLPCVTNAKASSCLQQQGAQSGRLEQLERRASVGPKDRGQVPDQNSTGARQVMSLGSPQEFEDNVIPSYRLAGHEGVTYTLSMEGIRPLSSSSCKKDRMADTLKTDGS